MVEGALARLAAVQEHNGVADQAVKTYERILSGYPLFGPALSRLAMIYGQRSAAELTEISFSIPLKTNLLSQRCTCPRPAPEEQTARTTCTAFD